MSRRFRNVLGRVKVIVIVGRGVGGGGGGGGGSRIELRGVDWVFLRKSVLMVLNSELREVKSVKMGFELRVEGRMSVEAGSF